MANKPTKTGGYKKNPETVNRLHEAFLMGLTVTQACVYADVSRDTYYTWCKKDKSFSQKMDRAQLNPFLRAKQTIMDNMKSPDVAKWYLERKSPEEFSTRQEVDHSFKNAPVIVDDIPTEKVEGK